MTIESLVAAHGDGLRRGAAIALVLWALVTTLLAGDLTLEGRPGRLWLPGSVSSMFLVPEALEPTLPMAP